MYNEYDDEKNLSGSGMNHNTGSDGSSYDHTAPGQDTVQNNQVDPSQDSEDTFPQNGIYRMKFETSPVQRKWHRL